LLLSGEVEEQMAATVKCASTKVAETLACPSTSEGSTEFADRVEINDAAAQADASLRILSTSSRCGHAPPPARTIGSRSLLGGEYGRRMSENFETGFLAPRDAPRMLETKIQMKFTPEMTRIISKPIRHNPDNNQFIFMASGAELPALDSNRT
jgi:hypothetical protein